MESKPTHRSPHRSRCRPAHGSDTCPLPRTGYRCTHHCHSSRQQHTARPLHTMDTGRQSLHSPHPSHCRYALRHCRTLPHTHPMRDTHWTCNPWRLCRLHPRHTRCTIHHTSQVHMLTGPRKCPTQPHTSPTHTESWPHRHVHHHRQHTHWIQAHNPHRLRQHRETTDRPHSWRRHTRRHDTVGIQRSLMRRSSARVQGMWTRS